ncbi:hypothetical protein K431DRAFT_216317 [Polychaeton citri CBS 116435]|uniref:Uncharacterized protein n=1 Tax=Polychaeton citri CBS 116435 TaxID=1314669 RepID=A0A9P4QDJ3_9PEZI|nr:hypothetical protein K431DRAFT_216317 [Polychaeton citri CBS 116435]
MQSFTVRCAPFLMALASVSSALDGITVPSSVKADQSFKITFQNPNDDQYRVFLAAAVTGARGPACYLKNSTDLSSPLELTIPAEVGPSADYYSIAIADLTTGQGANYSPAFTFSGGTGNASDYELHLGGAPFWDANSLPCSAISCVRECAQASYPQDLSEDSAYNTMKTCITECPGVSPDDSQKKPVHAEDEDSTTVPFSAQSAAPTGSNAAATDGSSTSSKGAASRRELGAFGAAIAGLAAVLL